ncbi:MAG: arginase family protein [Myxococcota bacterium]
MLPIPPHLQALNERASTLVRTHPGEPYPAETIAEVDAAGAEVNAWVEQQTRAILDAGQLPGLVGGDHSVSFGAIAAAARRFPGLGLLHIDAHADLREAFDGFTWSHASILYNVRTRLAVSPVVSVGIRDYSPIEARRYAEHDDMHLVTDRRIAEWTLGGRPFVDLVDAILAPLPSDVWITFDVDGLDPSLCPHTGTPVPGGLTYGQVSVLLDRLAASRRVVGFDLTEVGDGEWDANVGARLLYKLAGCAITTNHQFGNP